MNWLVETKFPTLYYWPDRAPSLSGKALLCFKLGVRFLARARRQDWHTGITQFWAEGGHGLIMGGKTMWFPKCSSNVRSHMSSWIQYILIPSFQCHKISSLWGDDKFLFSESPTQRKQEKIVCIDWITMEETTKSISPKKSKADRCIWHKPDHVSGSRPRLAFYVTYESWTTGKLVRSH
jgi:hypothetical protein